MSPGVMSRTSIGLVATLALVLAACGSGTETTESGAATTSAATSESPTENGVTSAETVATVSGGQLDLGDLEGKDTLLWFWAPW